MAPAHSLLGFGCLFIIAVAVLEGSTGSGESEDDEFGICYERTCNELAALLPLEKKRLTIPICYLDYFTLYFLI